MRQESTAIFLSPCVAPERQWGARFTLLAILVALQACLMWAFMVALPHHIWRTQTARLVDEDDAIRIITLPPPFSSKAKRAAAPVHQDHSSESRSAPTAPDSSNSRLRTDDAIIDWRTEREQAAADFAARDAPTYRQFGPVERTPAPPAPKDFAWDKTHTQRIEPLPNGGALIRLNDHCLLIIAPFPLPICGLGKRKARSDLFDGMQHPATPGDWKEPTLP